MNSIVKPPPPTPTLDKLAENADKRVAILDFLEWLGSKHGIHLASYHKHTDKCTDKDGTRICASSEELSYPIFTKHDSLVMQHLDIDEKMVEAERRALLRSL